VSETAAAVGARIARIDQHVLVASFNATMAVVPVPAG